jgi:ribose transport system substrate-binding protein
MVKSLSRREFLRLSAATAATGALAAACAPMPAAAPTTAPAAAAQPTTAPAAGKRLLFVWSPKATNNPVFDVAKVGGQMRAGELGDVDFQWVGPADADAQKQVALLDDVVSKGCDGLGVSCNDADALKPVIDRAMSKGIPVITWDSDSPDSKRLAFYSFDVEKAATAGGGVFVDVMKDNPNRTYCLLTGVPGAPNLEGRIKAVRAVLDKTDLKWLATEACYDDIQKGAEVVENRMTATPDLGGWFFIGGWPLFGDIKAMPKLLAAKGKTKVVTWDTLEAECQDLIDGVVQGLIGQKYFGWGYDGVGIMYDIVKHGKKFPAFIDSGFDLVTTPEQAKDFLARWKSQDFKMGESPFGNG